MAKKRASKHSAPALIEALSEKEDLTLDDAAVGLLRFSLYKAVSDPGDVSIRDIGEVLQGAARLRAAGSGSSEGVDEIMQFFLNEESVNSET